MSSSSPASFTFPSVVNPPDPYFPFTRAKTLTSSSSPSPSPSSPSFAGPDSSPPLSVYEFGVDDFGRALEGFKRAAVAGLITGAVLGATIILIGVCVFFCFHKRKMKKKKKKKKQRDIEEATINGVPKLDNTNSDIGNNLFTYEDLAKATDNFSNTNLIGQGGFGYVHRGVLSDGTQVAIKQLKSESRQGEREFQAEIQIISRVHHRHLVSLLGYCITGSQRLLVYDFVPNKTLEFHLHGELV